MPSIHMHHCSTGNFGMHHSVACTPAQKGKQVVTIPNIFGDDVDQMTRGDVPFVPVERHSKPKKLDIF